MAEDSNYTDFIHIETLQKRNSLLSETEIIALVEKWLNSVSPQQIDDVVTSFEDPKLAEHVSSITIQNKSVISTNGNLFKVCHYVYRFNSTGPEIQESDGEQEIGTQWILPTEEFNGLWESLIYDDDLKDNLLNYLSTTLLYAEKEVNPSVIPWNRVVLLHGPPGTGKTTLCKALAQKICIQLSSKFQYGHFVEVNIHSLFSKWFSESGKLVTKMFKEILSMVEDPNVLVFVLLDEVESLAHSRASAVHGTEPSDAIRVVNALLTNLDAIKRFRNVLILTTSNITEAIDVALIDRADIKQFIGPPSVEAIYQIYCSCIKELQKKEIIITGDYRQSSWLNGYDAHEKAVARTAKLRSIAQKSVGLSGRTLRKMPLMASILCIKTPVITVEVFLDAMSRAVDKHWIDMKTLKVHV